MIIIIAIVNRIGWVALCLHVKKVCVERVDKSYRKTLPIHMGVVCSMCVLSNICIYLFGSDSDGALFKTHTRRRTLHLHQRRINIWLYTQQYN